MKRYFFVWAAILAISGNVFAEAKLFSVTVKRVMGEYESRDELREYAKISSNSGQKSLFIVFETVFI